jgi:hypothetical protein
MTEIDICRRRNRRLKDAGLLDRFSPHSFRVATVTDLSRTHTCLLTKVEPCML